MSSSSSSNADQQAGGRAGPSTAPRNHGPVIVDSATYKLTPIEESNDEDPDVAGAVEALEQITLREVGNGYIVDTPLAIANLVDSLVGLPTTPPSLYLDIEGVSLGRHGSISIIQLLVLPTNLTYLIDIHTLHSAAFTTAGATGRTLQSILEDASIPKVFFDVRNDSDALYSHFSISLAGIHDIQLMELATRPRSKKFLHGLARCITSDLSLGAYEKRQWVERKDRGKRLFAPEMGGSYEVFNERPMGEDIALYSTLNTMPGDSKTGVHIRIAVYKSEPLDYQKFRHVALWFAFDNGADKVVIHITGPNQGYKIEVRENYDPAGSRLFQKWVEVGWTKTNLTKSQLVAFVSRTPIDNVSRGFNCQMWVGEALKVLAQGGYIEQAEYLGAVDTMIDITMEAKDEP
ncbi:hypothetical protein V500_11133 [Pseudogymnoascus sp. VKM F-4518 (FW-2643)]|nr:hypothetical protein V500_11133 [Pseudogymnoascus sp. VKM F-4518 (FW-2643)]